MRPSSSLASRFLADTGVNLLNVKQIAKASGGPEAFAVVMAAIVSSVDIYGV